MAPRIPATTRPHRLVGKRNMGESEKIVLQHYEGFGQGDLSIAGFSRLSEGENVEYRTYYDQVGPLGQLGLMEES